MTGDRVVLLCGFGAFGRQHAAAWRRAVPEVRLLVADQSAAARDAAVAAGSDPSDVAPDPADLMDRADLVDIVTPSHDHHPLARAALSRGKPVIIEKPAVKTLAEGVDLAALSGETGLPAQVQFVLRAHPLVIRAEAMLRGGLIGRLVGMDAVFTGWKRMRADASLLENDGVHMLDLMRLFAGAAPDDMTVTGDRLLGGPVPETVQVRLGYPGGVKGYLRVGITFGGTERDAYLAGSITTKTFTLIGDQGSIALDLNRDTLEHTEITYHPTEAGFTPVIGAIRAERLANVSPEDLLTECFRRFLAAVDGEGAVLCDLAQGAVEMTRLLDTARDALAE